MGQVLWACFDGGGNVPPSVGIAHELERRGHRVEFAGRPEMVPRVRAAGLAATELTSSYADSEEYAGHPRGDLFCFLTAPRVGEELLELADRRGADLVVLDAMFGAALAVAPRFGRPTAAMLHTFLHRTVDGWLVLYDDMSQARRQAGFGPLPSLEELWAGPDLFHVTSLAEFDSSSWVDWKNVRHGAPVLEGDSRVTDRPLELPPASEGPLALVSFSTALAQLSIRKLQRSLDALDAAGARAVVTTGALDPERLRLGPRARAVRFAGHGPLLDAAELVVTHGGHGTAMRALAHGVPMLVLAGQAGDQEGVAALDQPRVAAFVEERGVGVALPADAGVEQIRSAAGTVLVEPGYRERAREMSRPLRAVDGAALAADNLEELLG